MCGFAGFFLGDRVVEPLYLLKQMAEAVKHRGPDDSGEWFDESAEIGLTHRRLSILDLSSAGHQPMASPSGRFVIAFNGEIYNHLAIRAELEATTIPPQWRGHSDTETLLSGFENWGVIPTISRAVGMFAFAVWDRSDRTLTLCRDRMGEKPLYYGFQGKTFLFGSELKALRPHPAWNGRIDRAALSLYMRHNAVPAPWTIFEGIFKLLPGTYLTLSASGGSSAPEPVAYWSGRKVVSKSVTSPWEGSDMHAVQALDQRLRESIRSQMLADVPLGAFLSGGVDSSTIVALMQAQSSRPVKTFSIGFHEANFNEAHHASAVAQHLGTEHTELYVTSQEARAVIPSLAEMYDEPFADSSQIPTHLVARLARRHVTVSLSGDAGDELFGGYNRYFLASRAWRGLSRVPVRARRMGATLIRAVPPRLWDRAYAGAERLIPSRYRLRQPGDKLHKAAMVLSSDSAASLYMALIRHWEPTDVVIGADEPATAFAERWEVQSLTEQMMAWDMTTYLPDDILVKVDRAAMAVSLETRVPFLDHRVVEFAWRLPLSLKIRNGVGKWILRQVLYQYVPKTLIERPKMGFGLPIDGWLRGPLREWAENLLDERRLRQEGYFIPGPIRQKWDEHLSGRRNWQYHLWDVLMFESWLDRWK